MGCVACSYKLVVVPPTELDGLKLSPPCKANVRPEMCPRRKAPSSTPNPLYLSSHKILIVGDGDFTFSHELSLQGCDVLATSFLTRDEILSTYDSSALEKLEKNNVMHSVDATKLEDSVSCLFDRIIFNFPCIIPDEKGHDGQTELLKANQELIKNFLVSAAKLLQPDGGEIHVVHKTRPPFGWWEVPKLGFEGCEYLRSVVFDRSMFPTYIPRKAAENKSFPTFDAVTYCFGPSEELEAEEESELLFTNIQPGKLVQMTEKRLRQVVGMLQLDHQNKRISGVKRPRQTNEIQGKQKKHGKKPPTKKKKR